MLKYKAKVLRFPFSLENGGLTPLSYILSRHRNVIIQKKDYIVGSIDMLGYFLYWISVIVLKGWK